MRRAEKLRSELAGPPDERFAETIFVRPRRLPDEHERRARIPTGEDRLRAVLEERAQRTGGYHLSKLIERIGHRLLGLLG